MSKAKKGTPDNVDVHVGKRLRVRRSLLGISQEKLATMVDITFQQIQKYERGINRISASRLHQFSRILDVPVQYFFENIEESGQNATSGLTYGLSDNEQEGFDGPANDIMNQKETITLVKTYYEIKDENIRRDALKFLKSIAASNKK